mmetsp:Transcript_24308/g.18490  ORF Transcript_24308/g.18490 Transcript_24308/m.18490 type:complete len:119 (-) Transcript_24308:349-705(-)|eukprot:CAMPEP_0202980072 /NCGR_PEP_ID=MMETSP1396-20130829/86061_1 /ASSEMBLY_ACC=CAM_ASM_000872 /TAXON_ID= /ORGANISM="Pseudokeronopsis sp., Strain Brazil" /LENGTH=118 /DNA_ID=CAMNT_0049719809 /DNA_START=2537 /DNA_END=2893 /DNA_ORIENTATION=+
MYKGGKMHGPAELSLKEFTCRGKYQEGIPEGEFELKTITNEEYFGETLHFLKHGKGKSTTKKTANLMSFKYLTIVSEGTWKFGVHEFGERKFFHDDKLAEEAEIKNDVFHGKYVLLAV